MPDQQKQLEILKRFNNSSKLLVEQSDQQHQQQGEKILEELFEFCIDNICTWIHSNNNDAIDEHQMVILR